MKAFGYDNFTFFCIAHSLRNISYLYEYEPAHPFHWNRNEIDIVLCEVQSAWLSYKAIFWKRLDRKIVNGEKLKKLQPEACPHCGDADCWRPLKCAAGKLSRRRAHKCLHAQARIYEEIANFQLQPDAHKWLHAQAWINMENRKRNLELQIFNCQFRNSCPRLLLLLHSCETPQIFPRSQEIINSRIR
jgi:hypothetical protein